MEQVLTYFFDSPFWIMSVIVAGALLSSAARKIESEEFSSSGFFYLITKLCNIVGWGVVVIGSLYLSFNLRWNYFLLGLLSIPTGIIISFIFSSPAGWIADNFATSYKAIWIIKMYVFYIISIILLHVGLYGFFHYLTKI